MEFTMWFPMVCITFKNTHKGLIYHDTTDNLVMAFTQIIIVKAEMPIPGDDGKVTTTTNHTILG